MKKFSDFAKEEVLDGDKIKLESVIGKVVTVTGSMVTSSKYESNGRCLKLQIELDGKRYVIFTGSDVLINQIERYRDEIPFETTIKKIDKYYTFS